MYVLLELVAHLHDTLSCADQPQRLERMRPCALCLDVLLHGRVVAAWLFEVVVDLDCVHVSVRPVVGLAFRFKLGSSSVSIHPVRWVQKSSADATAEAWRVSALRSDGPQSWL